jgi:uncharacterized protein
MRRLLRSLAIAVIRVYQRTVSRVLPPTCRFSPSCSEYMALAIERHGLVRGTWLGVWRILRCNPFCTGGDDPVPESHRSPGPQQKPTDASSRTNELEG